MSPHVWPPGRGAGVGGRGAEPPIVQSCARSSASATEEIFLAPVNVPLFVQYSSYALHTPPGLSYTSMDLRPRRENETQRMPSPTELDRTGITQRGGERHYVRVSFVPSR